MDNYFIFLIVISISMVVAEPPSPYQYNRPQPPPRPQPVQNFVVQQQLPVQSHHHSSSGSSHSFAQAPLPPPSTSYGFPNQHIQTGSSSHISSSSIGNSFVLPPQPAQTYGPALSSQGTNQVNFVANEMSGLDDGLRTQIEQILLKEESRAYSEYSGADGTKVVSISMEGPRPSLNVAQFVVPVPFQQSHVSQPSFNVPSIGVPAAQYGPPH